MAIQPRKRNQEPTRGGVSTPDNTVGTEAGRAIQYEGAPTYDMQMRSIAGGFDRVGSEYLDFAKNQFKVSSEKLAELESFTSDVVQKQMEQGNLSLEQQKLLNEQVAKTQEAMKSLGQRTLDASDKYRTTADKSAGQIEQLGRDALSRVDEAVDFTDRQADTITGRADKIDQAADVTGERYQSDFVPIERDIARFAQEYDTPERRAEAAAKARGDVATATADQQEIALRRAASLGIDPTSGRYQGIERATGTAGALASVGAQNQARENVENRAIALRSDAANLGRGLQQVGLQQTALGTQTRQAGSDVKMAGQQLGNQTTGLAIGANQAGAGIRQGSEQLAQGAVSQALGAERGAADLGQSNQQLSNQTTGLYIDTLSDAVGLKQSNQQLRNQGNAIMGQGVQTYMQGLGGAQSAIQSQANTGLNKAQLALSQEKEKTDQANANASGWGQALGTAAGWLLSDENAKEDKEEIEEGAALEAVENMRVEKWKYKDGMGDSGEHIGTYAQDFNEEVGSGTDEAIPIQDAIGVTMKAVQDLSMKVDSLARGLDPKTKRQVGSTTQRKKAKQLETNSQQARGIEAPAAYAA